MLSRRNLMQALPAALLPGNKEKLPDRPDGLAPGQVWFNRDVFTPGPSIAVVLSTWTWTHSGVRTEWSTEIVRLRNDQLGEGFRVWISTHGDFGPYLSEVLPQMTYLGNLAEFLGRLK